MGQLNVSLDSLANLATHAAIDPSWTGVYSHVIADAPGTVAANTYLSVFNPAASGKLHIALSLVTANYSVNSVTGSVSMLANRTSAASAGTLVAANTVTKFAAAMPDTSAEVRIGNPTTTTLGLPLIAIPPAFGTGAQSPTTSGGPSGASFVMAPGQGIQFAVSTGDVDQRWDILYIWAEAAI